MFLSVCVKIFLEANQSIKESSESQLNHFFFLKVDIGSKSNSQILFIISLFRPCLFRTSSRWQKTQITFPFLSLSLSVSLSLD